MNLLKELSALNEGKVKELLIDLIDKAVKETPLKGKSYPDAVLAIIRTLDSYKHPELQKMSDDELASAVEQQFDDEDLHEAAPADAEEKPEWPKVIAKADEFRVELDENEQVHILDGEDTVRLSMPLVIWNQLRRQ